MMKKHLNIWVLLTLVWTWNAAEASALASERASETQGEGSVVEEPKERPFDPDALRTEMESLSSGQLILKAWEASAQNKEERLKGIVDICLERYDEKAKKTQGELASFPGRTEVGKYEELNATGTCRFIWAEFLMNHGKTDEAIASFQNIIDQYGFAQTFDPSRGSYWSVAEKAQSSIDVLTGKFEEEQQQKFEAVERTKPELIEKGSANIVDYTKYGAFYDVGTKKYRFRIRDVKGLAKAVGEGIYPNKTVYDNPRYKELKDAGRLEGSHWDFVNSNDLEAAYFKWATAPEPEGVKQFFVALTFEKAGMTYEALRAYHALIVHFPKTTAWTYWQTPWYPAQAAIGKIRHLLRTNPELGLVSQWMKIEVQNGFDNDDKNDVFVTYPGRIVKVGLMDKVKDSLHLEDKPEMGEVQRFVGEGAVQLAQFDNGHWQLLVDGKPYVIKGMTYAPTKIGQSPDKGTLANWMEEDTNENGKIDGPYDTWVDKNRNNEQEDDEPVVGDFALMRDMGVNTLRIYHDPEEPNKKLLREMYENYGIRVILGDFLGKYAIGSGASWVEGTDYENEEHKKNMMASVKKMVMENKDEPYVLMWLLGNENNYGVASNADKKPEAYFKFVNEVAKWIKSVDPNHPVAVNNGDTLFLDIFAEHAPDVDIFAANVYRGDYGFGSFWEQVMDASGKPAFIAEYGAPAFAPHLSLEEAEEEQAKYHQGNWLDIQENMAGTKHGVGNALGGVVFEWSDEWWKNYQPFIHDRKSDAIGPFPGGYYFEEWFGIVGQGNGSDSPFMRQLRKAYFVYKELWSKI